jgi:hypothetical protein
MGTGVTLKCCKCNYRKKLKEHVSIAEIDINVFLDYCPVIKEEVLAYFKLCYL